MLDSTAILLAITISLITIFVVIAFLMGFFRKMINIGAFMGPNATIFAIGSKYTEKENVESLLNFTGVNEVVAEIEREGYHVENLSNYDIEIEKSMLTLMKRVVEMLPDDAKEFANAYLMKYDAQIVKRILRAKMAKVPKNRIYAITYEGRHINQLIIQHMIEATTVEDAISALDATSFSPCIKVWNDTNDLYRVELTLDRIVMENLVEWKRNLEENTMEPVNILLSILVDIYNIRNLVRAKVAEMENIQDYVIQGGYELGEWKLKAMMDARTLDELLAQLEGTSYSFLRDIEDPFEIEMALDKMLLKKANEIGLTFATSAGPMVMFLVAKEYEARNLKAIVKGFVENLPKERIMNLLVIGDAS